MNPQFELYCRHHGFVLVDRMGEPCPKCRPEGKKLRTPGAVMASIVVPAVGCGIAVGFGASEVLRWIF